MTKPTAFRFDDETDRLLDELAKAMGGSRTAALKIAVRTTHQKWVTKPKKEKNR